MCHCAGPPTKTRPMLRCRLLWTQSRKINLSTLQRLQRDCNNNISVCLVLGTSVITQEFTPPADCTTMRPSVRGARSLFEKLHFPRGKRRPTTNSSTATPEWHPGTASTRRVAEKNRTTSRTFAMVPAYMPDDASFRCLRVDVATATPLRI